MADSHTRQAKRTPVSLKIKFKSATLDQFIERYSVDVSHGGIFIRTKDPLPVGTTMRFEFQLKDASPLITGEGTVVWTREHDPQRAGVAPGMGVRFDRLADSSQEVLNKILAQKASKEAEGSKFTDMPTRVAPRPLVDDLAKESKPEGGEGLDEGGDSTPLPNPMPFHSDVDDFPDEAFEEATKVRSLDDLVAASATGDEEAIQSAQLRAAAPQGAAVQDDGAAGAGEPFDPNGPTLDAPVGPEVEEDDEPTQKTRGAPAPPADRSAAGEQPGEEPGEAPVDELAALRQAKARERDAGAEDDPGQAAGEPGRASEGAAAGAARAAAAVAPAVVEQDEEATAIVSKVSLGEVEGRERGRQSEMSSTSIALALVAVLLLVLGGGGYFLLTRAKSNAGEVPSESTAPASQAGGAATPDTGDGPGEEPAAVEDDGAEQAAAGNAGEPEVERVEVEVRSEPEGAMAELVGSDQSGPTPVTFEVDASESHTVRVTRPGYVTREITIDPEKPAPAEVALERAPKVIRIESEPEGAYVYVNGLRVPGRTPNEFEVPERWRDRDRFKVSLRKAGYEKLDLYVAGDEFESEDDASVIEVSETLEERTRPIRRRDRDSESEREGDSQREGGDSRSEDGAKDSSDSADGASGDSGGAEAEEADSGEATPDGAETDGAETDGAETDGAGSDGAETDGAETDGAEAGEAEAGGAEAVEADSAEAGEAASGGAGDAEAGGAGTTGGGQGEDS